ncbi:TERF1-interacting nuclear factor 2 [Bagarius yarrelli]|uniref:TERF1-interacting nuclear factor 2 n=1 Tax=Bagarius yarrelli TaxID=175774 RepID=A0A556U672_BAGYA|nr:TERF1-interacting nuclear factor 2 [Bagarius yarrelli]
MRSGSTRSKNNNNTNDEPLPTASLRLLAPPLRLVSAAMWKVMQQRDAMHYGKVEEFVTSVSETVPGLLSYRHQAKLSVGLRARLILELLHVAQDSNHELIFSQLERLRAPALPNSKKIRKDEKVEQAVKNFHTLVQTLLKNPAEREQFFKEEFDSQYGPQFDSALEKLLWEFLTRLDQLLPVPDLAQTVSWLTAAPAVIEECARSASQPQLLRTLLQHEKCLGHLDSAASIPSSTGDSILSSLSLPLSGKVQDSNQSEFTRSQTTSRTSPTSTTQKGNKRQVRGSVSHIPPVIGLISTTDIPHAASTNPNVESDSDQERDEVDSVGSVGSVYTRVRTRSCRKSEILENVPDKEQGVEKVLITAISQTPPTSSEVKKGDESRIRAVKRNSGKSGEKDKQGMRSGDKMLDLGQKRKRKDSSNTSLKNSKDTKSQEEEKEVLHADLASCMKPLRVIIPRLDMNSSSLRESLKDSNEKEHTTTSSVKSATEGVFAARHLNAGSRKRKLDPFETPEKNQSSKIDKQLALPASPHLRLYRWKIQLFTKRYCKTKSDTYIPTLHEFWTPPFFRRDLLSPGNGCR